MTFSKLVAGAAASALMSALAAFPASGEEAQGRWAGVLPAPVGLHIVLEIGKTSDGRYNGALTSPDQSPEPIVATSMEVTPNNVTFSQDKLQIKYAGHWDSEKKAWVGVFSQGGRPFPLNLTRESGEQLGTGLLPPVVGLNADWVGALNVEGHMIRLILHISSQEKGTKVSVDSPDQGAFGIPVAALDRSGDTVSFKLSSLEAAFVGKLSADGLTLAGTFTQGGHDIPLTLSRKEAGSAAAKFNRPQEDAAALGAESYRQESVTIENASAPGVRLGATLTLPQGPGPFPAAVLISGSGPNGRDEEAFKHKFFLVLADHLTRHGIAVLRYDKRGVAQSTGDYKAATTEQFASDAEAAVSWLRRRPEIAAAKVGLIGHSEGGVIAPMVAARDRKVAFVVMLAGSGVPGDDLLPEQDRLMRLAEGDDPSKVQMSYELEHQVFRIIANSQDAESAKSDIRRLMTSSGSKPTQAEIEHMVELVDEPWMRFFLRHDPAIALKQMRAPTLVLNGQKDLQVPPALDLPPIRRALADNPDATIIEMPGLNHVFQHATSGSPTEYAGIEETLAPELLKTVTDWIHGHVG